MGHRGGEIMNLIGNIMRFFVSRRASGQTYGQICELLKTGGQSIDTRLRRAADSPENRQQAGHVIGMERWGAQRLASVLDNTAAVVDEYDSYRPAAGENLASLADAFQKARAETLSLAARLEPYADQKVVHNNMGEISVKTWLSYLNSHANMESESIK